MNSSEPNEPAEKVEVLIAAMHQTDMKLFAKTKVTSCGLLINQCDRNDVEEIEKNGKRLKMISTTERGLSRSRNLAIKNAIGDYCLICDNDEILCEDYEEKIIDAYRRYPDADIICFKFIRKGWKKYSEKPYKIGYLRALKVSSPQISLKPKNIREKGLKFDVNYGAGGAIASAGEENIFLYDCLKKRLKIYYLPVIIAEIKPAESTWFKGYTEDYFFQRGAIIYRLMGKLGFIYCTYFAVTKYRLYKDNMGRMKAFTLIMKGWRRAILSNRR